jgi:uncharacterized repeat protein (TIGR01451 family)
MKIRSGVSAVSVFVLKSSCHFKELNMSSNRIVFLCVLLLSVISSPLSAESLYVSDHSTKVFSFDVLGGAIEYRNMLTISDSGGGVDLEIDDEHDILFRTVEFKATIDIIEAQSLTHIKTIALPVQPDAGIVYDAPNSRLLCTERNSNKLYIFLWDATLQTLTYQEPTILLDQIQNACDLAINGDTLYVSEYLYHTLPAYKEIYAYDMSDDFSFIDTIDMGKEVVSMDYNATDNSIYGGAWYGHQNIAKKTLDPNDLTYGDIGACVVGMATNSDVAGKVFVTTRVSNSDSEGTIECWDASDPDPTNWELVAAYTNSNSDGVTLSGLTGLCVGKNYIEPSIVLTKTDDANGCLSPDDVLTYTLTVTNYSPTDTATGVVVIDYLPEEVYYPGADYAYDPNLGIIPPDPGYYKDEHAYVWHLGDIAPGDSNSVSLTVEVTRKAQPGFLLTNNAVAISDNLGTSVVEDHENDICCWDTGTVIYVDETATGYNNGTSWADAYTELQKAINRAEETACTQSYDIYVAQGTYCPDDPDSTFELPDNMSVYGGFMTGGCDFSERNLKSYKTILTGQIDGVGPADVDTVVTMGDNTLLDGFTVTKSIYYAIYGSDVDFTVENCVIEDNDQYGIRTIDGNITVKWCKISKCGRHGIRHEGDGFTLNVDNSQIIRNQQHGIFCLYSTPTVKNSLICESGLGESGHAGIRTVNPKYRPVLYNNTLANNRSAGISFADDADVTGDPNNLDYPDLQNTIVYYNNPGGKQVTGFSVDTYANFSCIQDCNEPDTTNYNDEPGFAYTVDPNGTPDPENYHLAYDAFCKDKANPFMTYTGQVDIDGEERINSEEDPVDIGADEVYDCDDDYISQADISNDLDWDADGQVNYVEFSRFSEEWLLHDPNDPSVTTDPNFADDPDYYYVETADELQYLRENWDPFFNFDATGDSQYEIDIADLEVFLFDTPWLWIACWKLEEINAAAQASAQTESMMSMPLEMSAMSATTAEPEPDVSVHGLVQLAGFLDELIADDPENLEAIQEIRKEVMDEIKAIINDGNQ